MVDIRPFQAVRPDPQMAQAVASPPYDVLTAAEALSLAGRNPTSFVRVIRSEVDLPPKTPIYDPLVYQQARLNFEELLRQHILIEDLQESFFLYRLSCKDQEQTGLVGCVAVSDYDTGLIKIHEKTRPDKENDRLQHALAVGAHCGPVFLTIRPNLEWQELVEQSTSAPTLYNFTDENGVRHTVWRIEATQAWQKCCAGIPTAYVADGHHRAKTASRLYAELSVHSQHGAAERAKYFLAVLFPTNQLRILAYNRIIWRMPLSADEFIDAVRNRFPTTISSDQVPPRRGFITCYVKDQWHLIDLRGAIDPACRETDKLDVSLLQNKILSPLLGIDDPRTDDRLGFVGGNCSNDELKQLVDNGAAQAAISLYPVSIEELLTIADAGELMPPKSTWFEPKLMSGLFVHRFR